LRRLGYFQQAKSVLDNVKKLETKPAPERRNFRERQVYVENKTSNRLVIYLKYHTFGEGGQWQWRPGNDLAASGWASWTVQPGESSLVVVQGKPIQADRIRFVVKNDRNETLSQRYWGEDLVLVAPGGYEAETIDRYSLPLK
jgi:hypothetical protein